MDRSGASHSLAGCILPIEAKIQVMYGNWIVVTTTPPPSIERLTRERARQIEQGALHKLYIQERCVLLGELLWAKEGGSEEYGCEGMPDGLLV
jgi:hypothetical protein